MDFVSKLNGETIIELINYCISESNKEKKKNEPLIDHIKLMTYGDVTNSKDFSIVVQTFNGDKGLEAYLISDYSMTNYFYGEKRVLTDYSIWYKIFMAKTFGVEYIEKLKDYRREKMYEEIKQIEKGLGITKK